jgi:hypothetical protein
MTSAERRAAKYARYNRSPKGKARRARYYGTPRGLFTLAIVNNNQALKRLEASREARLETLRRLA